MARSPVVGGIGFSLEVDDSKFIQQLRKAGERGKRELNGTTTEADRLEDQLRQTGAAGEKAMQGVAAQTDRVADQMERARRSANALRNTVSGLALGAAFVAGTKTIAQFSQSMSTLQAVSGATGGELDALRNKALALGATTRFSATQAADAMGELARAGFTANEVLAAIGPTLSAAQAGGVEIATAAEIIGTTIRGFGLEAGEAARVADVLAQAANASNAGITDLGEALKFAAPTAQQLGLDLEETIAIIGKLSDGGLKGGLAGRGFQSLATQIVNNRDEIKGLIGDFDIAQDGLGGIIKRLKEAGITTEQVIKLFRAENLDTFGILANAAIDGSLGRLDEVLRAAEGSSARAAKIMDDNLNGAILAVQSRLEALIIALGDAGAADALIAALEGLGGLLKIAADNADVLQAAIIALSVRALLPMAVAMGGRVIIASVVALQAQLVVLTAIAGRSTGALATTAAVAGRLVFALGPLTIGIAAAAAAYVALARNAESAERALDKAGSSFDRYAAILKTIDDDTSELEAANDRLTAAIENQGPAAVRAANTEIDAIRRRIAANEQLSESYANQSLADLNAARGAIPSLQNRVREKLRSRGFDVGVNEADLDRAIRQFNEKINTEIENNEGVAAFDLKISADISAFEEARIAIDALEARQREFNAARREEERDYASDRDFAGQADPFQQEIDAEEDKIKRLEDDIRQLERSSSDGAKRAKQDLLGQIAVSRRYIEELRQGIGPELARTAAEAGRDQAAISEQLAVIDQLNADITFAQAQGRDDIVKKRREELKVAEDTLALLQQGGSAAVAREIATPAKTDDLAKGIREANERLFKELGEEYDFQTPVEALEAWRVRQIEAIEAVAKTAEERADAIEKLEANYRDRSDQLFIDQETGDNSANAILSREAAKKLAIEDTLAARDLEIELQLAQLRGDEEAVKALEAKADRQQRINDLISDGLTLTQATARADEEIARIKAGQLTDADAAKKEFVGGLAGDVSSALLNAVRSGDYGAIFQEVINSSAARGLEDAINGLAEEFANFAGNIIFGRNGSGGLLSGIFGATAGTPPILDAATAAAATETVTDAAGTAAEAAATASVTALSAAAAGGAASLTALATGQAAVAVTTTPLAAAMAAVTLAAQAAASALATIAASGTGTGLGTALSSLPFGGGRARGGPVIPGKFYEVNEGGLPELLSVGQRKFLLPGSSGEVTPLAGSSLPAATSREVARHEIYVHGTGNAEIEQAVDRGVQRSVKIARAQAGPAAAEFQTRKV